MEDTITSITSTASDNAAVDLCASSFGRDRSLSPEPSTSSFELGLKTPTSANRTSTPIPTSPASDASVDGDSSVELLENASSASLLENASSPSPTDLQNAQEFDSADDYLILAASGTDADTSERPSKKRKFDNNNDSATSLVHEPAAEAVPVVAAAVAAALPTGGMSRHAHSSSGFAPPATAGVSVQRAHVTSVTTSDVAALEQDQQRELTILANKVVIKREVQMRAFAKCAIGQIVLRGWADQNKIYYTIPSKCPNLYVKVTGDIELRSLEGVELVFNVEGKSEKIWMSKSALTPMIECLKKFKPNSAQVQHIEHMTIDTLNGKVLRVTGQYGKIYTLEFTYLQNLINALTDARTFVMSFGKYLSHRDRIVNQYLVKLVGEEFYNTSNRCLNVLKFLTLYNTYMKDNNCNCPWDYLAQNVVDKMMNCFTPS